MFLNEVVLGKEHHITRDDPSFTAPPKGFDSVVALGMTEPGFLNWINLNIINKKIIITFKIFKMLKRIKLLKSMEKM